MDAALQQIISLSFILFALMISGLVFLVKRVVIYGKTHGWKGFQSDVWSKLILPVMPIVVGITLALAFKFYPFPPGLTGASGRFVWGVFAGMVSSGVYTIFKNFLEQKTGVKLDGKDETLPLDSKIDSDQK